MAQHPPKLHRTSENIEVMVRLSRPDRARFKAVAATMGLSYGELIVSWLDAIEHQPHPLYR